MSTYLAADFGGGSGRIMAGTLTEGKLKLEEVYRFGNRQIRLGKHVYWDFLSLFEEMKKRTSCRCPKRLSGEKYRYRYLGSRFWAD